MLTIAEAAAELERAGRPCADLNGRGPGLESTCPCCPGSMEWRPDDGQWRCKGNGCDPRRIADELHLAGARTWQQRLDAGALEADEARRELATIWGLDKLQVEVTGARIVGRGAGASADVFLSSHETITFQALRDAARPSALLPELAASVGATPALKQAQALRGVSLLRMLAEHHQAATADDIAREWGHDYLAAAERLESIDWDDQAQRWQVFQHLRSRDPFSAARDKGISVAAASLVVVAVDERMFVRTSWFRGAVRQDSGSIAPAAIAVAMMRVGWQRPGSEGRIIARRPGFAAQDVQTFYIVPPGWDDSTADEGVKADEGTSTRTRVRAQPLSPHQPSSLHQGREEREDA